MVTFRTEGGHRGPYHSRVRRMSRTIRDYRFLFAAALGLAVAGCSQRYDSAMESAGTEPVAATTNDQTAAATTESAPAETQAEPAKRPDVNSSGPVGKTILAPTDALD